MRMVSLTEQCWKQPAATYAQLAIVLIFHTTKLEIWGRAKREATQWESQAIDYKCGKMLLPLKPLSRTFC